MGKKSYSLEEVLNKGAWTATEDNILITFINIHGEGKWTAVPYKTGLKRSGKSCRLRWLNYLRPNVKRGNFSEEEDDLIIRLHKLLGNRWSLIAGRLPARTDNEIKNYWNTTLCKKARCEHQSYQPNVIKGPQASNRALPSSLASSPLQATNETTLIRTNGIRCNKLDFPLLLPSFSENKQEIPTNQLARESKAKESNEMSENNKVGPNVEEGMFQELFKEEDNMVPNNDSFDDYINNFEFPDQAIMDLNGLMDFESWMLNDENLDHLPEAYQFDLGGEV